MPAQPAFVGSGAASGANTPLSPQPPPPVVLPPLPHIPQPLQPAQVTQPGYAQSAHQSAYAVMGDIPPRSVSGSARTVPLDGTEVVRTNSNSQATQTPHMKKLHGLNPKVLADGTLDTLREKLVSALKEGNLTDVEFVVGNSKDKVGIS